MNDRTTQEALAVLADIADAIGDSGQLGETHGNTIRRVRAERDALLADVESLRRDLAVARQARYRPGRGP